MYITYNRSLQVQVFSRSLDSLIHKVVLTHLPNPGSEIYIY